MQEQERNSPLTFGTDPQSVRRRVEAMEQLLERLVVIPGINKPVGLDVILDLVPVVGDVAAAALGAYIVWEAKNLGMMMASSPSVVISSRSGPSPISASLAPSRCGRLRNASTTTSGFFSPSRRPT